MAEVATIEVIVQSNKAKANVDKLRRSMRDFDKSVKKAQKNTKTFTNQSSKGFSNLKRTILGVVAAVGAFQIGRALINTIREFERLRAVLKTVEGGAEAGARAFELIRKFTATTPFQLQEVTKAFLVLRNTGIAVTEERLIAFGNVAAATGKSIEQFAEAVADAAVKEFERLKEFGVLVRNEGDTLRVSFQGTTTVIANTRDAVVSFLEEIGNSKFAGALEEQSKTLNGVLSNISDQFSFLAFQIGEGGLRQALTDLAKRFLNVSAVGSETAAKLGQVLGNAVRKAGSAFIFLLENIEAVGTALTALAILKAVSLLGGLATAVTALGGVFKALRLAAITTWAAVLGPITIVGLAIASVIAFVASLAAGFVFLTTKTKPLADINATFKETLGAIAKIIKDKVLSAVDSMKKAFNDFKNTLPDIGQIVAGVFNKMVAIFVSLPEIVDLVASKMVDLFTAAFDKIGDLANTFGQGFVAVFKGILSGNLDQITGAFDTFNAELGQGFNSGFKTIFSDIDNIVEKNTKDVFTPFVAAAREAVIDTAIAIAEGFETLTDPLTKLIAKTIIAQRAETKTIEEQNEVIEKNNEIKRIAAVKEAELAAALQKTTQENQRLAASFKKISDDVSLSVSSLQRQVIASVKGKKALKALNIELEVETLLRKEKIPLNGIEEKALIKQLTLRDQLTEKLKDNQELFRKEITIIKDFAKEVRDFATQFQQAFVNATRNIEDSIIDLARTGKLQIRDLVNDILKDLARIGIRKLITGPLLSRIGFEHGGQFQVGGSGGPDSQTVAFKASPREVVTITPPGGTAPGFNGTTFSPNITLNLTGNSFGQDANASAIGQEIGDAVGIAMIEVLLEESRKGGILNR